MTFSTEFWFGLAVGIIGILATLAVAWYQRQIPKLEVTFHLSDDSPARLRCLIHNRGRGQARDVAVGFTFMLPLETRIFARPEVAAEIREADSPPDPLAGPAAAVLQRAFAVHIPRIAPKDTVEFELHTQDPDNQRASEQLTRINVEIAAIVAEFGMRLLSSYPLLGSLWKTELILSARKKRSSFFTPASLSYERGRLPISVLSEEEQIAEAHCQDLYSRLKPSYIDIFEGRPSFIAPVIRVRTAAGSRTYAIFPPYVKSEVATIPIHVSNLKPGVGIFVYPAVPESYG